MERGWDERPSSGEVDEPVGEGAETPRPSRWEAHEVTGLLRAWRDGDDAAFDRVVPLVYEELKLRARRCLAREPEGHTLQPTALVHELYFRLIASVPTTRWADRGHFFAVAARCMRQILVDHARGRARLKRGGGRPKVSLTDIGALAVEEPDVLMALHDALDSLAELDPLKASLIELRFFGGLTVQQAGEVAGCSTATLGRHWRSARAWLHRELTRSGFA